ncbi:hypothetical protein ACFSTC_49845 [Nonomuraea ferruginea]
MNKLVTAALVLFTTGAAMAPIARLATPPPTMPPVTAVAFTAPVAEQQVVDNQRTKKVYVVQPPHGRHHESLWEIAEKCLGDGQRYPEIFRLNQHKEQPDGARLRMADLIRPGWVLDMPDDARNTHIVPADQARAQTLKEHPGPPKKSATEGDQRGSGDERAGKGGSTDARKGERGSAGERPGERGSGDQRSGDQGTGDQRSSEQGARDERSNDQRSGEQGAADAQAGGSALLDVLSGASLAAAGLLALLAVRRREQLWRRLTGRRVARPQGDAADAEVALRMGADMPGARILDLGLRLLGAELGAQGRTPPTVYAAHLSARSLDLWIHPKDDHPPAPWTADDGGQVWRLPAREGRLLPDHGSPAGDDPANRHTHLGGAPYPGLVSIGTDRSGRVLVDLEAAQGLINIRGPQTTAALAALAVELATNRWSDRMRVTLVGFGEELTAIAPDRIRAVGGPGRGAAGAGGDRRPPRGGAHRSRHRTPRRRPLPAVGGGAHPRRGPPPGPARQERPGRIRGRGRRAARHLDLGDHRGRHGQAAGAGLRGEGPAAAAPPLPGAGRPVPHRRPGRRRAHPRPRAAGRPPPARGRDQDPRPRPGHRPAAARRRTDGARRRAARLPGHPPGRRAPRRARRRAVAARRAALGQGRHDRPRRVLARPRAPARRRVRPALARARRAHRLGALPRAGTPLARRPDGQDRPAGEGARPGQGPAAEGPPAGPVRVAGGGRAGVRRGRGSRRRGPPAV